MKKSQVAGLVLWRAGVFLAAGYVSFLALREILEVTDPTLELSLVLLVVGALALFLSVVLERWADLKKEDWEEE